MFLIDRDKTAIQIGEFFATSYPSLEAVGISVINILHRQTEMWIDVNERLPKNNLTRVLVFLKDNEFTKPIGLNKIDTDRCIDGKWVRWGEHVTHWMYLPDEPIGF